MIIGRENERKILKNAVESDQSSFVAIYGRRRVGKTFLVKETFNNTFTFYHTGAFNEKADRELKLFSESLTEYGLKDKAIPSDWYEAFNKLKEVINRSQDQKKIIFLDELSWMDTKNSHFINALEYFWNSYASGRKDIVLIISSSSSSWIFNKVIHNRGGLYNRLNYSINLEPFNINECNELLLSQNIKFSYGQILTLYMVFGGVPYYWALFNKEMSADQNINFLLFSKTAPLKTEYDYLFRTIFNNYENHNVIIKALSSKKIGLTRDEIITKSNLEDNGALTNTLNELIASGFIRKYNKYGNKSREALYQIIDNFILFNLYFGIEKEVSNDYWSKILQKPIYNTWCGLAFEVVILEHIDLIKKALGINGIISDCYSFRCKENIEKGIVGSQIDLLIDRADKVINLCEIKYSSNAFYLTKSEYNKFMTRKEDFISSTGTKKYVSPLLIVSNGYQKNEYTLNFNNILDFEEIFNENNRYSI